MMPIVTSESDPIPAFSPHVDRRDDAICQRVALPSFPVLVHGAACEERTMKELVLPVPRMVSASYGVPVSTPMGTAEARQKASAAVEARLTGPLRTLTAELAGS